jgi:hypothetical protein
MSVTDYPNTSAVMFRVLLDVLASHYMDSTGKIKPILQRERTKNNRTLEWYPTLRQNLKEILYDPNPRFSLNPQARKTMLRMVENDDNLFSLSHLDQFVHNKFEAPTEPQLRKMWAAWEELVKHLFVEHPEKLPVLGGKS